MSVEQNEEVNFAKIEKLLGFTFINKILLLSAVTHRRF